MKTITVITILLICAAGWGINTLNRHQCANNVTEMGKNYRYDAFNGCRIEYQPGKYVYWKMYREINQH